MTHLKDNLPALKVISYRTVWMRERDNFVALTFAKVEKTAAAAAFTSPTSSSVVDPDLVAALKEMGIGDAISLPKGQVASERSFKVRVNKAAKVALRKLEWGEMGNNYVIRVAELIPAAAPAQANGTANQPASEPVTAARK